MNTKYLLLPLAALSWPLMAEQVEQDEAAETGLALAPVAETSDPAPQAAVAGGSGAGPMPYSIVNQSDAPGCSECGSIMIRNGACYKCPNCGSTSGCS